VDFAIGVVNSVINLPNGQVKFFEEFKLQENCEINLLIKTFLGLPRVLVPGDEKERNLGTRRWPYFVMFGNFNNIWLADNKSNYFISRWSGLF